MIGKLFIFLEYDGGNLVIVLSKRKNVGIRDYDGQLYRHNTCDITEEFFERSFKEI